MVDSLFKFQTENLNILIVEDTQSERCFIAQLLQNMGLHVSSCSSAEQAILEYERQEVDIVISDWRMPGITGPELCEHLKSQPFPPYIILLTSNNLAEHMIQGIESGADDFISKPFVPSVLKVRILAAARIVKLQQKLTHKNSELNTALANEHEYLEQIQSDMKSAVKLQSSHLPSSSHLINQWHLATRFKPAQELAGDIFQCIEIDKTHIGFYLLDVTGHGIAASMQSFTLAQQLSCNSCDWESLDPALIVNKLNQDFEDPENKGRFATLILGIANSLTGEIRITVAGHPQPILLDDKGARLMELDSGLPLGIDRQFSYRYSKLTLKSHQHLMLYSDGLYETQHPKFGEFGLARLVKTCSQAHSLPAESLLHHLSHAIELWQQKKPQDDISMMLLSAPNQLNQSHIQDDVTLKELYFSHIETTNKTTQNEININEVLPVKHPLSEAPITSTSNCISRRTYE
ncbi:SpoIIE family protein phosphatase [Shewanella woodyi]|uniref:SpoIIE family protein phosphatase n=1 Tax=Shewanella woodyi TaxID=60961 RepID=UPI003748413D